MCHSLQLIVLTLATCLLLVYSVGIAILYDKCVVLVVRSGSNEEQSNPLSNDPYLELPRWLSEEARAAIEKLPSFQCIRMM